MAFFDANKKFDMSQIEFDEMKKSHYDFQSSLTSIFPSVVDLYLIFNKERKGKQHFQPIDGLVISASS